MTTPLTALLAELDARVQADYMEAAETAAADPQQAGHLTEATWSRVLQDWLPDGYSIGTRRYITPETNSDSFETDIVVFRSIVPKVVREQTRVPHGAVAAAFFARRTADRAGLRDAVDRAVRLRRSMKRSNSESEAAGVSPAYPIGFLALSHGWSATIEETIRNVTAMLVELDEEYAAESSESLDLCCIANLGTWSRKRVAMLPPTAVQRLTGDSSITTGCPMSLLLDPLGQGVGPVPPNPVGLFVREVYSAMEDGDPRLKEFAYSLRKQIQWPDGLAQARLWR